MQIKRVWQRLMRGELHYILGRFALFRRGYGAVRGLALRGDSRPVEVTARTSLFQDLDVNAAVEAISRDAVFLGVALPPEQVREIVNFCRSEPLLSRHEPEAGAFYHADIVRGFRPDGRPAPVGAISDPLRCDAVRAVAEDPGLRAIARAYLGYEPTHVMTLLYWSFASGFSDDERRQMLQHVIDYHYDVGGYSFVYASFYLLDTTVDSGAHVMVKGSHKGKTLGMLLGSAVAPAEAIYQRFGRSNEIAIEGPAGTGFIQDTACYHRASPPTRGDRLMLQIRFS